MRHSLWSDELRHAGVTPVPGGPRRPFQRGSWQAAHLSAAATEVLQLQPAAVLIAGGLANRRESWGSETKPVPFERYLRD